MVTICPQVNVCGEQLLVSLVQAVAVKMYLCLVVSHLSLVKTEVLHAHGLEVLQSNNGIAEKYAWTGTRDFRSF